jgi:FkbM family methyltransferase
MSITSLKAQLKELPVIGRWLVWARRLTLAPAVRASFDQNLRYDRETAAVMAKVLRRDSNAIDVGAHKGGILREIVRLAPDGRHIGCEPIPALAADLRRRFPRVTIHQAALSHRTGTATFAHIVNRPGFSGLVARTYDFPGAAVQSLTVDVKRLDDIVPAERQIAFVKIDCEGGDLEVLRGGIETIRRSKPVIVFEAGSDAAAMYCVTGEDIFDFIDGTLGYRLSTMRRWLDREPPLSRSDFMETWTRHLDYYFIAYPPA